MAAPLGRTQEGQPLGYLGPGEVSPMEEGEGLTAGRGRGDEAGEQSRSETGTEELSF